MALPEDTGDVLGRLARRDEIRDVVHRYCFAVDRGSLEDVLALFHDPCALELIPGRRYEGRAAVRKWYDRYMRTRMGVLRHLIHNQLIDVDGDEAVSRSYFDAVGDLRGESIVVAGFYDDRLRRLSGRWRFVEKVIRLDFLVPLHEGWGGKKIKRTLIGDID
jgi:ketosteroid isomerase-like protein